VRQWCVQELAVDLGTAHTLIYGRGQGLLLHEPSVLAIHKDTGELVAVGREALAMLGREPRDVLVQYPLRDGTVADEHLAALGLAAFLERAHVRRFGRRLSIVMSIPSSATDIERAALREIARQAGADRVHLVEEGLAAALGIGPMPPDGRARMIVDIGGGTTSVSIVSAYGVIAARALRVAGAEMTEAILEFFRQHRDLLIGWQAAEETKIELASVLPFLTDGRKRVRGKSAITGEVEEIEVTAAEIAQAIERPIRIIINAVRSVIEAAPPDVAADLHQFGIILTGGGSLVRHLSDRLREELSLPVSRAERPLETVIEGMAKLLEHPEWLARWCADVPRPPWEEALLTEDARPSSVPSLSAWTQERPHRRRATG
jgi:rod shape-determining protein MreB